MPILIIWAEGADIAVRSIYLSNPFPSHVSQFSVLMQWAEGGSLDDFIDARLGRSPPPHIAHMHPPGQPLGPTPPAQPQSSEVEPSTSTPYSRSACIRAFRELQRAPPEERERLRREMALSSVAGQRSNSDAGKGSWLAIHLLSAEEVKSLFLDVVEGLAFLVGFYVHLQGPFLLIRNSFFQHSMTSQFYTWT